MQKSKLLYLLKIFYEQTDNDHGLTVGEIINQLEEIGIAAERKAIYDDINTLRDFGIDIEMRKDKNYRYHLVSRSLELPELSCLWTRFKPQDSFPAKKARSLSKSLRD